MRYHVIEELLICIIRACKRGRNAGFNDINSNLISTCDHIENIANEALLQLKLSREHK